MKGRVNIVKAAVLKEYSKKDGRLAVCDVPVPVPGDREVLVKIKAAGVNPLDNMIIRGDVKLIIPYQFPLIMGNEFAGVVEKTGGEVTDFAPGERVYGRMPLGKIGSFAEYAAVDRNALAKVPPYLSDEEAASVPLTALTALQAFELMDVKKNGTVFISGATGSLGAMAIPIAKNMGLHVITNGSARNKERVERLGADLFLDYKTEDYTEVLSNVDYVLDTLGGRELEKEFRILKIGGKLVSLKGMPNAEFALRSGMPLTKRILFGMAGYKYDRIAAKNRQKYYFVFVHEDGSGLQRISDILQEKKIAASLDSIYDLSEVNEALLKVERGGSKGKTIIKIN